MEGFPIKAQCKPVGDQQVLGWDTSETCKKVGTINAVYEDLCKK